MSESDQMLDGVVEGVADAGKVSCGCLVIVLIFSCALTTIAVIRWLIGAMK